MKLLNKYIAIIIALPITSNINAQLKVQSSGSVGIGIGTTSPNEKFKVVGNSVFTLNTNTPTSAAYIRGNNAYSTSATPDFTWWGNDKTGFFHPSNGVIGFTADGFETMSMKAGRLTLNTIGDYVAAISINATTVNSTGYRMQYQGATKFYVHAAGWMFSQGGYIGSDRRFKSDIKIIESPLAKVLSLNGIVYKRAIEHRVIKNDESKYLGVIAQDVEKIVPEVVKTLENGYKAVNYAALVPLLIEAIKEQQVTIEELKEKLNKIDETTGLDEMDNLSTAALAQNAPNPFNEKTEIKYFIPENSNEASLFIYNMNGVQIKEVKLTNKGNSSITISGSELDAGMYLYALIVDGKELDTKRMLLTK
jgi:hypothetical protein